MFAPPPPIFSLGGDCPPPPPRIDASVKGLTLCISNPLTCMQYSFSFFEDGKGVCLGILDRELLSVFDYICLHGINYFFT